MLLHISYPQAWGQAEPSLWLAAPGIALALVAWLGPAALALIALDGLLLALQVGLLGTGEATASPWPIIIGAWGEVLGTAVTAGAGWWAFARAVRGTGQWNDPRSAALFLVTIPGVAVGLAAAAHLAAAFCGGQAFASPAEGAVFLSDYWLPRALGSLAVGPVLLATVTPWLVRRGLAPPELRRFQPEPAWPTRPGCGEWLEITGLALGTGGVSLVLAVILGRGQFAGWQLWGLPLLFIVWASLRQGLRAGTAVACTAALLCLLAGPLVGDGRVGVAVLRGNLFAQCCTALLVGASVSWIRAKEARYRQVVGHIPILLYSTRVHRPPQPGRPAQVEITFASPASRQLLGCDPERLQGDYDHWLCHVQPQDRELLAAAFAQLFLGKKPVSCEYRVHGANGEPASPPEANGTKPCGKQSRAETWVRDTLVPHIGGGGEVEGWEGVVEDITAQRHLSQDLRRTTSMLHALIANLPTGVFFAQGPSGKPVLVNARARHLLGRREDACAGLAQLSQVYRLLRPDGTPYPPEELPVSRALRQGLTTVRDDIVVHRPDGSRVPLVTWAAPLDLGGHGRPDAAVWVLEDLTTLRQAEADRRRAEAVLRASEEKYRGVVESLPLMLLQTDRDLRITYMNPATQDGTGYTRDELQNAGGWQALTDPEDVPRLRALQAGALAGQTGRAELRYRARDGAEKVCHAIYQPLRHNGQVVGLTALAVDMTVQRRLEGDLQQAQRLELVGRLASGIAHDFNNLLTVILTLTDLAADQLPGGHPVRHELGRIGEAGEQAARLAGQLLAFSKQRQVTAHRVDLNEVTARALDLVRSSFPSPITVEMDLAGGALPVLADETQLQQVVMNLCLNARDAMPQGGRLVVRTALREAPPPQAEARPESATRSEPVTPPEAAGPSAGGGLPGVSGACLSVADTGHGMAEHVLSRIFDPFFSTKERGTGLGLAVVQQIVAGFGGRIAVWSQPGKGTRFDIWLPCA